MKWGRNSNYHRNPCKDCTSQRLIKTETGYTSCKSHCEKWAEWRAEETARKQLVENNRNINIALYEMGEHRAHTRLRKA